jgi:hypothetical protein
MTELAGGYSLPQLEEFRPETQLMVLRRSLAFLALSTSYESPFNYSHFRLALLQHGILHSGDNFMLWVV